MGPTEARLIGAGTPTAGTATVGGVIGGDQRARSVIARLIEYEAVVTRHEHLAASRLPVADVETLLDAAAAVAEPLRLEPLLSDADDDMVLETAMNGRAMRS